ncbi:MAG TPA: DUF4383 domain-containing protein [Candidatus Thermoplasmatota archaeon]|nr:DUF4383 domain-containing protein [Candidatus Thermoplasmatota archaeon]
MSTTRFATSYARTSGILVLLLGIVGIVSLATGYIGLIARDFLLWDQTHNVLHVVLGLVGVYVGFARNPALSPILYGKVFGVVYVLLALIGFVSATALASLSVGLELGENLVHLLLGVLGLLAGFYVVEGVRETTGRTTAAS